MSYAATLGKMATILQELPEQTQLSMAVTKNTQTRFYGLVRQNGRVRETDNARLAFEIGSVTKAFTAHVLAQLVVAGRIHLDAPVQHFLPFDLAGNPLITFKQLALHTSGLPGLPSDFDVPSDYDKHNPYKHFTEKRLIGYLSQYLQMDAIPGERYQYSNLGAGLLGYLLSLLEGKPFAEVVRERVFVPLNMQHSGFDVNALKTTLVTGIDASGNSCRSWEGGVLNGCLGIISTAADMAKFAIMAADTTQAAANLQAEENFAVEPGLKANLGWGERIMGPQQVAVQGINGGTAGSSASIMISRDKNVSLVVLSNIAPQKYMEQICPLTREWMMQLTAVNSL